MTINFDDEKAKKPAIDRILSDKEKNEVVRELQREDEVGQIDFIFNRIFFEGGWYSPLLQVF